MRLGWVRVTAYRRFLKVRTLQVTGKLTALIGPNEAGKTSILDAMEYMGHDGALAVQDRTRGVPTAVRPVLEAGFFIEQEDREELTDLPGGGNVRILRLRKDQDGTRAYSLDPKPRRDLSFRRALAGTMQRILKHRAVRQKKAEDPEFSVAPLERALNILQEDREDLDTEDIEVLGIVRDAMSAASFSSGPKYLLEFPEALQTLIEYESEPNPHDVAISRLRERLPTFEFFREEDRYLHSSYELSEIRKSPPAAIRNLTSTAGLHLGKLWKAIKTDDQAEVNTIETRANNRLADAIRAWTQSGIRVELRVNGETLLVQIRDEKDQFSGLDERSDGLRQFVALLAFCMNRRIKEPILLIDEAEAHLHYDAQADLIDVLARQPIARQVIYTTHSLGCLPENLGSGIKLIAPAEADQTKSDIVNRFWADNQPGFSPILFGMGATTLAFMPVRVALLVEGPTDHILLPHLFMEGSKRSYLGFQVVPGLSSSSREQVPILTAHGTKVLFLVDNDEGGDNLANWLESGGVDRKLILRLASRNSTLGQVEDAIDDGLFVSAVNAYVAKWNDRDVKFDRKDLPPTRRYEALEAWCDREGCPAPGKVDLAYEIIECASREDGVRMVKAERARAVSRLRNRIESVFESLKNAEGN